MLTRALNASRFSVLAAVVGSLAGAAAFFTALAIPCGHRADSRRRWINKSAKK
ncbi:MAG: hypothetical protein WCH75_01040 [Candidatus Binatia bacterium]